MKTFFTKLHYAKNPDILQKMLAAILSPASFAYCCAGEIRNFLYKKNLLKTYKPDVLTISVGNITTGGTGKTPITAAIANYLSHNGYKTAILSRGYGSKLNPKDINVISDGEKIYFDAATGGDEPVWLAQNCPNTVVLTSSNRVQIAKHAHKLGCNALILDDGFQHRKLGRDINIAVVDSEKMFGNKKVLPAGPLREGIKNLPRANLIIIVNKGSNTESDAIFKDLPEGIPVIRCGFTTDNIYEIHSNKLLETDSGKNVLAFSAIGQPEQFYKLVRENNLNLIKTISFPDHHRYSEEDVRNIFSTAQALCANAVITTEKDAVKVKNLTDGEIYALKLKADFNPSEIFKLLNF